MSFDPAAPLRHVSVANALIVPFGSDKVKGVRRSAGVLDSAGQTIAMATCWRDSAQAVTKAPPALPATRTLSGKWLFGGMLYAHFGHFLCESTARLWGVSLAPDIQGVVFLPKPRLGRAKRLVDPLRPWFAMAGVDLPVEAPMEPVHVETLLIPEQGFGTGDMVAGRPEYRDWARRAFGAGIAAEGGEKLYISRSRLYSKRGRILGEAAFEAMLADHGYDIFHPQDHAIDVQVARYKAARQLISTDCSALHLAAFFAEPGDQVAILARRPGSTIDDFLAQYHQLVGITPHVTNHLTRIHHLEGARLAQMSEVYAEVDYPAVITDLATGGFVPPGTQWDGPSRAELDAELAHWAAAQGSALIEAEV
jgi:capsular polysaccharide biosynthesis protein